MDETRDIPLQPMDSTVDKVIVNVHTDEKEFHFKEVPKVLLSWQNLSYEVKVKPSPPTSTSPKERFSFHWNNLFKKVPKTILSSMSGFVRPHEVLAIMGPSGAGKTSLLNILAQRVKPTSGEILANGIKVGKAFKSISAFVQQDDVLLANLTVRETLRYAAMLRLGNVSMKERMRRVDSLMQELGLSKVADTLVGSPGLVKGISGGERKRLCIAIELLTQPSVLFLDEPTTGLDAKTSLSVIHTINKLAENGRTVVLTIHQPRSDIFQSFDRLLLLSRGRIAYFGKAQKVLEYFSKLGHECPASYNPADFFMDLVTENPALVEEGKTTKEEQNQRIESILARYTENFEELVSAKIEGTNMEHLTRKNKYTSSWFMQFFVVLMRAFLNTIRNKAVTMARLMQQVSTAFLLGLIYLNLKNDQTGVQDRLGILFFSVSNMFFGSLSSSLNVLLGDKPVFNRERGAKMYRVSSFYAARVIADIPSVLFFPLLFGCIVYYWVGLNSSVDRFLMFLLIQAVLGLTGQALGIAIASISPNPSVGYTIMPVISTILMLFGGFYLNLDNVPVYFVWIYWTSIFHFAFEAFCINEFTAAAFDCPSSSYCPFPNGATVLENLAMDSSMSTTWINIGLSCALILVYHTFAYLCLRFLFKPRGG